MVALASVITGEMVGVIAGETAVIEASTIHAGTGIRHRAITVTAGTIDLAGIAVLTDNVLTFHTEMVLIGKIETAHAGERHQVGVHNNGVQRQDIVLKLNLLLRYPTSLINYDC